MIKIKIILYLAAIVLLTACSMTTSLATKTSQVENTRTLIHTDTPAPSTATFTPSATFTATSTPTPSPVSPTPAVTNTSVIPPDVLNHQCLEVTGGLPPDAVVDGRVVLADKEDFSAYLLDMKTGGKSPLPQKESEYLWAFAVSPDRQWLAYEVNQLGSDAKSLIITKANGGQQAEIAMERWWNNFEWLDNERLAIERLVGEEDTAAPLVILNPFTGERQELWLRIQGIYMDRVDWGAFSSIKGVYDPTLTRVVYPLQDSEVPLVLRDMQTEQDIVSIPFGTINIPKWSPDGTKVAVVRPPYKKSEFFLVGREGDIAQVTHLNDYLEPVRIYAYKWSPDGRHIAFWLNTDPNSNNWPLKTTPIPYHHLAVLDTATGAVTDYCIPGNPGACNATGDCSQAPAPIWSPNGQQLIVQAADVNDVNHTLMIIVDIANNWAAKIAANLTPVGWMVSLSDAFMFGGLLLTRVALWGDTRPELSQTLGLIVTSLLLVSSFFMNRAETAMAHGDRKTFLRGTLTTIVLGIAFLAGVVGVEWQIAPFGPGDNAFGAVFFIMTGMHAFHVLTGVVFLLIVWNNGRRGLYSAERHWAVEAAAVYWHFVDVVWIFFYPALYLIGKLAA